MSSNSSVNLFKSTHRNRPALQNNRPSQLLSRRGSSRPMNNRQQRATAGGRPSVRPNEGQAVNIGGGQVQLQRQKVQQQTQQQTEGKRQETVLKEGQIDMDEGKMVLFNCSRI